MQTLSKNQPIIFTPARIVSMSQKSGVYPSGKPWTKWSMLWRGEDGVLYQAFQKKSLPISAGCQITGTFSGVSAFQYRGEKVLQVKNARLIDPEVQDTEEAEAEALGDNIALHRADNPDWWITEGREHLLSSSPAGEPLSPSWLTADQEEAAWAEYYGLYDETFSHPNEKP